MIGEERVNRWLKQLSNTQLESISDDRLVVLMQALIAVISSTSVDSIKQQLKQAFSNDVWFRLSKPYLKHLFSTYARFVDDYELLTANKSKA